MSSSAATIQPTVNAFPAKTFFVNMLIRDIDLKDAILDLLDNCLDGAMRLHSLAPPNDNDRPYENRWAEISFDRDQFSIKDNCGGIPVELAQESAFRMGRIDKEIDKNIQTVGVYGIGMKRAIFKLGRDADIQSRTANEQFTVQINKAWMDDDHAWTIPISIGQSDLDEPGTHISVKSLREEVARLFSNETDFVLN